MPLESVGVVGSGIKAGIEQEEVVHEALQEREIGSAQKPVKEKAMVTTTDGFGYNPRAPGNGGVKPGPHGSLERPRDLGDVIDIGRGECVNDDSKCR
jgi:hypothetical protein